MKDMRSLRHIVREILLSEIGSNIYSVSNIFYLILNFDILKSKLYVFSFSDFLDKQLILSSND